MEREFAWARPASIVRRAAPQETTTAAIAILDPQFPWLRASKSHVPGPNVYPYPDSYRWIRRPRSEPRGIRLSTGEGT